MLKHELLGNSFTQGFNPKYLLINDSSALGAEESRQQILKYLPF